MKQKQKTKRKRKIKQNNNNNNNKFRTNEYIDFALLLSDSKTNPEEVHYIFKFDTDKGGQPSEVFAPDTKRQTINNVDQ